MNNFSLLFKFNFFFSLMFFTAFLSFNNHYSIFTDLLLLLATISTVSILYMLLYIPLCSSVLLKRYGLYFCVIVFSIIHVFTVFDFFIYRIYHFHVNAMVIDILSSPDAIESLQLGLLPKILAIAFIVCIVLLQCYVIRKLLNTDTSIKHRWNKKYNKLVLLPLVLIVFAEKITYGSLVLYNNSDAVVSFDVIPAYQPLTFTRFLVKHFDFKVEKVETNTISKYGKLNYPINPIAFKSAVKTPNIFVITLDSLSSFVVNKENTPNIEKLKLDSTVFENHYSGGNATRFGIFSLFYGLNSTYWFPFLNENKGPVLIDVLKQLNYDINLISSTSANWPEFRKTAYINSLETLQDKFEGTPWQKDQSSSNAYLASIQESQTPQFSFLFLDAPHGYSFPAEFNKYNASTKAVNYLTIDKNDDQLQQVVSMYKNSVFYNDYLIGKIITQLKSAGLYDDSIIIFTSDHGQEFYQQGYFGHNSAFSKTQVKVPFVIKLPSNQHQKYSSLSSHNDLVPTLLSYLGVNNPVSDYSNGINLLNSAVKRDYVFTANWNKNAVITNNGTFVFSNLPNKMFRSEIRDNETYEKIANGKKINPKYLFKVMNSNKHFMAR